MKRVGVCAGLIMHEGKPVRAFIYGSENTAANATGFTEEYIHRNWMFSLHPAEIETATPKPGTLFLVIGGKHVEKSNAQS